MTYVSEPLVTYYEVPPDRLIVDLQSANRETEGNRV